MTHKVDKTQVMHVGGDKRGNPRPAKTFDSQVKAKQVRAPMRDLIPDTSRNQDSRYETTNHFLNEPDLKPPPKPKDQTTQRTNQAQRSKSKKKKRTTDRSRSKASKPPK